MDINNSLPTLGLWFPSINEMLQWLATSTAELIYNFAFEHPIIFVLILICVLQWWHIRTLRLRAGGTRLQMWLSNWALRWRAHGVRLQTQLSNKFKMIWVTLRNWLNHVQEQIEPMRKKVQAIYSPASSE